MEWFICAFVSQPTELKVLTWCGIYTAFKSRVVVQQKCGSHFMHLQMLSFLYASKSIYSQPIYFASFPDCDAESEAPHFYFIMMFQQRNIFFFLAQLSLNCTGSSAMLQFSDLKCSSIRIVPKSIIWIIHLVGHPLGSPKQTCWVRMCVRACMRSHVCASYFLGIHALEDSKPPSPVLGHWRTHTKNSVGFWMSAVEISK